MGLSDLFCPALQVKSQDILNVVHLTSTEKKKKRFKGWKTIVEKFLLRLEFYSKKKVR